MPGSGPADGAADRAAGDDPVRRELEALEDSVERLLRAYGDLRERVDRAEAVQQGLVQALGDADLEEMTAGDAGRRFLELAEENRQLRQVVEEGRRKAERIRSRLMMMEDEL